jgi:lysophospholipase L1-like esterase
MSEISPQQWAALSQRHIYFGHQSVGADIVLGIRDVLAQHPEMSLRLISEPSNTSAGFREFVIGENGNTPSKNAAFLVKTAATTDPHPVMMFKYCWADVGRDTDVDAMFRDYRQAVAALRARHPDALIVHITMPLTVVESPRAYLGRRLRGKSTRLAANAKREHYNELMRSQFMGEEPFFDLAALESSHADGTREYVSYTGTRVYALAPEWTQDGGHLNAVGRERVAAQLLIYLATLQ